MYWKRGGKHSNMSINRSTITVNLSSVHDENSKLKRDVSWPVFILHVEVFIFLYSIRRCCGWQPYYSHVLMGLKAAQLMTRSPISSKYICRQAVAVGGFPFSPLGL